MMKLHESGENYLETILVLEKKNGYVRSIDIANELNFSKPSVSRAMKLLKENNYIEMDIDSHIILTEEGRKKAEAVYDRHNTINEFFIKLGVSKEQAEIDACRIEHIISEETLSCIKKVLK